MRAKSGDAGLAKRVKELREKYNITQEKLAELADISLPLVQKIENTSLYGSKKTHEKLAKTLGVSVAYLVYGDEEQKEDEEEDPLAILLEGDPTLKVMLSVDDLKNMPMASKRAIAAIIRAELENMRNSK